LAIVREHARALGGDAVVETSPNGGARFRVTVLQVVPKQGQEQIGVDYA
jgi:signal transduction histidine kinase